MNRDEALNKAIGILTYNQVNFCKSKEAVASMNEIIEALEKIDQEPCEDAVSRQAVFDLVADYDLSMGQVVNGIHALPPVTPQPEDGRWIYDKNIDNWKCSECGETPKTIGYCGSAAFMAEHFKYCNHCGAKMQEVEEC